MWTITMLKQNAKAALKGVYWSAVVVSILVTLLLGTTGYNNNRVTFTRTLSNVMRSADYSDDYESYFDDYFDDYYYDDYYDDYYYDDDFYDDYYDDYFDYDDDDYAQVFAGYVESFMRIFAMVLIIGMLIGMALSFFVGTVVTVGQYRFYIDSRLGRVEIGNIFHNFKNGAYLKTVATMFIMSIKIMLWYMLFIVPGIIKTYEYFLVPYIIADNPHIERRRAFEISKKAMDGEKLNCWVLQLSFIGWNILAGLVPFGNLFVAPYYNATMVEFYSCMKQKVLASGYAFPDEMGENAGFFGQANGGAVFAESGRFNYVNNAPQGGVTGYNPMGGSNNGMTGYTSVNTPQSGSYTPLNNNPQNGMTPYRPISQVSLSKENNAGSDSGRVSLQKNSMGGIPTENELKTSGSYTNDVGVGIGDNEKDEYKGPEV